MASPRSQSLDLDEAATAREIAERTLEASRSMMTRLLDRDSAIAAGDLTRTAPEERRFFAE